MSVRRRGTAALVALAAALSLAACGSDGGSEEKSAPGSRRGQEGRRAGRRGLRGGGGEDRGIRHRRQAGRVPPYRHPRHGRDRRQGASRARRRARRRRVRQRRLARTRTGRLRAHRGRRGHPRLPEEGRGQPQERRHHQRAQPGGHRGAQARPDPRQPAPRRRQVRRAVGDRAHRVRHPPGLHLEGELPAQRGGARPERGGRQGARRVRREGRGAVRRHRRRQADRLDGALHAGQDPPVRQGVVHRHHP